MIYFLWIRGRLLLCMSNVNAKQDWLYVATATSM